MTSSEDRIRALPLWNGAVRVTKNQTLRLHGLRRIDDIAREVGEEGVVRDPVVIDPGREAGGRRVLVL